MDTPTHYTVPTFHPYTTHHTQSGPRQPWHDIHSRLEGPIAWDVLQNFHQRWEKQAGLARKHKILHLKDGISSHLHNPLHSDDGKKLNVPDLSHHKNGDPKVFFTPPDDPATWNVQLFRSIDSDSVVGFPEDNKAAYELDLVTGKGTTVERSIHKAYIYAIRRAQVCWWCVGWCGVCAYHTHITHTHLHTHPCTCTHTSCHPLHPAPPSISCTLRINTFWAVHKHGPLGNTPLVAVTTWCVWKLHSSVWKR